MRRRVGHQLFYLVAFGCDVAGPDAGVVSDVLIELRRSVVLPQPAEDEPYGAGLARFRCALIGTTREGVVNLFGVGRGEVVGCDSARNCNDCFGRAAILPFPVFDERGEKDPGNRIPLALGFGCANSFCSASNWSAARFDVKDLRTRFPFASRQSAYNFPAFSNIV
jgi:hypothetical protein